MNKRKQFYSTHNFYLLHFKSVTKNKLSNEIGVIKMVYVTNILFLIFFSIFSLNIIVIKKKKKKKKHFNKKIIELKYFFFSEQGRVKLKHKIFPLFYSLPQPYITSQYYFKSSKQWILHISITSEGSVFHKKKK